MPKTYWNKQPKEKRLTKSENLKFRQWLNENIRICQICGTKPPQDCHHLSYGSYGADKDDMTQIAVCRECHKYCHDNKHESQEKYMHVAEQNYKWFKELK